MVKDCMENDHGFVIVFQKELKEMIMKSHSKEVM